MTDLKKVREVKRLCEHGGPKLKNLWQTLCTSATEVVRQRGRLALEKEAGPVLRNTKERLDQERNQFDQVSQALADALKQEYAMSVRGFNVLDIDAVCRES
jgi:hypothetical protein